MYRLLTRSRHDHDGRRWCIWLWTNDAISKPRQHNKELTVSRRRRTAFELYLCNKYSFVHAVLQLEPKDYFKVNRQSSHSRVQQRWIHGKKNTFYERGRWLTVITVPMQRGFMSWSTLGIYFYLLVVVLASVITLLGSRIDFLKFSLNLNL